MIFSPQTITAGLDKSSQVRSSDGSWDTVFSNPRASCAARNTAPVFVYKISPARNRNRNRNRVIRETRVEQSSDRSSSSRFAALSRPVLGRDLVYLRVFVCMSLSVCVSVCSVFCSFACVPVLVSYLDTGRLVTQNKLTRIERIDRTLSLASL